VVDSRPIAERLPLGMEKRIERGLAFGFVGASSESGKSSTWVRGLKSVEPPSKLSETSVVEIGSVSKTMTGILIHLAVLEGKLSLSTKLEEILPSLREKPAGAITVAALGLHCSGLPRSIPGLPI